MPMRGPRSAGGGAVSVPPRTNTTTGRAAPRGAEGGGAAGRAPADHERDVGLDGAERGEAIRAVDVGDLVQRYAETGAQRPVVDRTRAARAPLGRERDDAVNRRPGLHEGLERRTALGVESDPGEAQWFHRRLTRTTSRTASITSVTSASVSRGLSGRLSSRP